MIVTFLVPLGCWEQSEGRPQAGAWWASCSLALLPAAKAGPWQLSVLYWDD